MSSIQQQPLNITVLSGQPIRSPVYEGGCQIINRSLDATIWVADNTAVADGAGTPIYPGTSLQWQSSGDLFMILGSDASSSTAGLADVTISFNTNDWQPNPIAVAAQILNSGVLVIDNPTTLLSAYSLSSVTPTATIDVSKYQSVWFEATCQTSVPNNEIALQFGNPGGGTFDYITRWTASQSGQAVTAIVPVVGSSIRFFCSKVGSIWSLYIVGSHRPAENIKQVIRNYPATMAQPWVTLFQDTITPGYPPGDTQVCQLQPWVGELEIDGRFGVNTATPAGGEPHLFLASMMPTAFAAFRSINGVTVGPASPASRTIQCTTRVAVHGEPLALYVRNPYPIALQNSTIRVTPLTGGLIS